VSVSQDDPRPPYRQIADDIRASIESGSLTPGQRLAAGRELAKKYGVAQQTVARAIEVLKAEGLLESHPPRGTFVTSRGDGENTPRSAEFQALMSELDALQQDLRTQMDAFEERLRKIEREIRPG
jgi:GntR family transcriptional regulator